MTGSVVVDASALAAIAFEEDEGRDVAMRLADVELIAPALLRYEMANTCRKKIIRNPDLRDKLLHQHTLSLAIKVDTHEVDHDATLALAAQLGLSAYDASYLWLARHLRIELVTLDERLQKAVATI